MCLHPIYIEKSTQSALERAGCSRALPPTVARPPGRHSKTRSFRFGLPCYIESQLGYTSTARSCATHALGMRAHEVTHAVQVLLRVHTGGRVVGSHGHVDLLAVPVQPPRALSEWGENVAEGNCDTRSRTYHSTRSCSSASTFSNADGAHLSVAGSCVSGDPRKNSDLRRRGGIAYPNPAMAAPGRYHKKRTRCTC
jgi:hypothetical protein